MSKNKVSGVGCQVSGIRLRIADFGFRIFQTQNTKHETRTPHPVTLTPDT